MTAVINVLLYLFGLTTVTLYLDASPDFENYKTISEYYVETSDISTFGDVGFAVIVLAFSRIFENWHSFFSVLISISLAIKFIVFRKLNGGLKLAIFYTASLLAVQDVIQIRTGLATTFFLLAYYLWPKRKLASGIVQFFGITLQASTLLLFPLALLGGYLEKKGSIKFVMLVVLILAMLGFSSYTTFLEFERVSRYVSDPSLVSDIKPTILSIANLFVLFCIGFGFYKSWITQKCAPVVFYGSAYFLVFFLFYEVSVLSIRVSQLIFILVLIGYCEVDKRIRPIRDLPLLLGLVFAFPIKHLLLR